MTSTRSLLVELFVEELPPKALKKLGDAFAAGLLNGLKKRRLVAEHAALTPFATPRRLAAHISGVLGQAPDEEVTIKLMPKAVGLGADGTPTQALRKNLAKQGRAELADVPLGTGLGPDRLLLMADGKAESIFMRSLVKGSPLLAGLQGALEESIEALPIPKVMNYQLEDGWTSVDFVRPVHGLVALHGADELHVTAFGLTAGRDTRGHRFESPFELIRLQDADHYARVMEEQGAVIAGFERRRTEIQRQLQHVAAGLGLRPVDDAALLDEVTALVERPNVLLCRFDREFLAVPQEVLILTMKTNQKYFPLLDEQGRLTERFLVVSNIRPADPSRVVQGNERVVRPRLADAKFFFDQDRKRPLESRVAGLAKVVYHGKLGSQGERVERVRAIARGIAGLAGGPELAAQADRAALLAKADLLTDMVGEFPELQGVMGGYYARHDGESEAVAVAIEDHYRPRFAGDELPRNEAGRVVALADKLETLAGLFGIGQVPSGDRDPFALRRHALGVVRMLVECEMPLSLPALVALAFRAFPAGHGQAQAEVGFFLRERLAGYLRDQGYSVREVEAVLELHPERWAEVPRRLAAVRAFSALPEAEALAAANKRVGNILRKSDADLAQDAAVDPARLVEPAERALFDALQAAAPVAAAAFDRGDYAASLQALAVLRTPVDEFFDRVMVNAEDAALRANRLALLRGLHASMNRVADLSRLAA